MTTSLKPAFAALAALAILTAATTTAQAGTPTAPPVLSFEGHDYFYTATAAQWVAAEAQARWMGGHLVAINSAEEQAALEKLKQVIARVDILTINDAEARQLSGEHSLVKAAEKILAMGPKYLVVKKGEHGALLFGAGRVFFAPALPLEDVVDPTGAGDTFAGGFIGYLARSKDHSFDNLKRAIIVGSALASFTCEKFGIERLLEITREDIDERIQQFVDLVDFDIELVEG